MSERPENLSAAEALERLKTGNQRFAAGALTHPNSGPERRRELMGGQSPFATIITCADSRVPVEILFDQGLGDLFVIRVAGNINDDAILGSVEYAAAILGVNLTVVMGHKSCGAVGAAVDYLVRDGSKTGTHIDALVDAIRPAVQAAAEAGTDDIADRRPQSSAKRHHGRPRDRQLGACHLRALRAGRGSPARLLRPRIRRGPLALNAGVSRRGGPPRRPDRRPRGSAGSRRRGRES